MTLSERFWTKVDAAGDCWLWTAYKDPNGYGRIRVGSAMRAAHRVVWQMMVGPIPDGLTIDHLCRVRHCVNPDHLEPVTNAENLRRGIGSRSTPRSRRRNSAPPRALFKSELCQEGHSDWYVRPSGRDRYCRTCKSARRPSRAVR